MRLRWLVAFQGNPLPRTNYLRPDRTASILQLEPGLRPQVQTLRNPNHQQKFPNQMKLPIPENHSLWSTGCWTVDISKNPCNQIHLSLYLRQVLQSRNQQTQMQLPPGAPSLGNPLFLSIDPVQDHTPKNPFVHRLENYIRVRHILYFRSQKRYTALGPHRQKKLFSSTDVRRHHTPKNPILLLPLNNR